MAKKRTSLDSILPATTQPPPETRSTEPDQPSAAPKPARKQLAVYLEPPIYKQLRTIAFEEETKMHPLLLEGLDRVFADRGLPSIAELLADE